MYEKRRTHKNIKWFKQLKQSKKSGLRGRPIAPQGSTVAVLFTVFIAKVQRHHKYRQRKFLNWNITILMAPLIPSVVIPPGICRASCRCQRRKLCQKTSSRRGVGLLSILLEAVNVVPFFQYFTVTSKLVEKKLTFFSDPPVGVLYEPPGPSVGLLKPFQKKKWQMPDKCPGVWARLELTEPLKALLSAMPTH